MTAIAQRFGGALFDDEQKCGENMKTQKIGGVHNSADRDLPVGIHQRARQGMSAGSAQQKTASLRTEVFNAA